MTELHNLSAAELSAAYRKGKLSPVEVAEAALARIAAWEPKINAMYKVLSDSALAGAKASAKRWKRGKPLSAIDGVPVTLKENIATQGDRSPIGTKAGEHVAPSVADAPPAARLKEAGAVILGKTTMPDWGMLSSGLSSLHGITRNPWRLDRNTSGSSSGAGAAAVAGYAPLHLGTDIGGSVRLPATHCGIFALKPSLGRVPIYPPYVGRVTGPMTRTVADAALLMGVITGPDGRDFMNLPPEDVDYAKAVGKAKARLKGLRIGFLPAMDVGLPPHPEVAAAAAAAAKALGKAGATVETLKSFLTPDMMDGVTKFFEARSCNEFISLPGDLQGKVLPFIAEWCTYRAQRFSGREVMAAYNQVVALREATVRATLAYDYVLSPTSPILPYEAELPAPGNDPHNALPHIAFTAPYNFSEQPAASLNWSYSADGLPIGVQVIGRRFDDVGVLRLSRVLELLRPEQKPWPEL
jgi:Asp-tRNA(Asn)/Glu-tRNA(Gln) amidotransferase A subunit family amidase